LSRTYRVIVSDVAREDLRQLRAYLIGSAGRDVAETIVARLLSRIEALKQFPDRGPIPKELLHLQFQDYRQANVAPYRIVYKVLPGVITVMIIADGRRDFAQLLRGRLIRGTPNSAARGGGS